LSANSNNHCMFPTTMFSTTMATNILNNLPIVVWCLLIDHSHRATFGEPFPVFIRDDQTTHDLKIKICMKPEPPESRPILHVSTNQIEIWKCKTLDLSTKVSFGQTRKQLRSFKFSDDESSDVQHIGVSQKMRELALKDGELLLALVPQNGTRYLFLCSTRLTELPWRKLGPGDDHDDH
jgi:hypothetical protein